MGDSITAGIDRFFDGIDRVVDAATGNVNGARRIEDRAEASNLRALVRPKWRLIDAMDAETGRAIFVVTDGHARCECDSRATAEKILAGLTKDPTP